MPNPLFDPDAPLDARRAVAVYETLRRAAPGGRSGQARRTGSLRDVMHGFDALLLDGFGVLNVGARAVPGAADLVAGAAEAGIAVMALTNGASRPSPFSGERYRSLGLPIGDGQVVSSRDALLDGIGGIDGPIGVAGPLVQPPGDGDRYVPLDPSRPEQWTGVAGIAFLGSTGWDLRWQEGLLRAMAAGVPVHVANPDVTAPLEDGFSMEPGFWVAAALDGHPEADVRWYGKPHGPIFELALERLESETGRGGWDRGRIAMVGDTLHTDILGANAAGFRSVLVTGHGLFAGGGADEAMEATGIRPDFVAATV